MAASIVQTASGWFSPGLNTLTLPSAPTPGNLLVILGGYQVPMAPINGWQEGRTFQFTPPTNGSRVNPFILYKTAGASEPAAQTPLTGATVVAGSGTIYEISGITHPDQLRSWLRDVKWRSNSGFSSPWTGAPLTADLADSVALMHYTLRPVAGTNPNAGAGWTTDASISSDATTARRLVAGRAALALSGTITPAITATTATEVGYVGLVLADGPDTPTEPLVTQAPVLGLMEGNGGEMRLTQVPSMALVKTTAPGIVTQIPSLALIKVGVAIETTQAAILVLGNVVPCVSRWCQCWAFTRLDGVQYSFTSHDEPVQFMGRTFKPCASLNPSATEGATDIAAIGNMELSGIISDDGITEFDLFSGKFDGCRVEVWEVSWDGATEAPPLRLAAGKIGTVSQGRDGFRAEVLGLGAQMQQQAVTQVVTPACRFVFGDERCTKPLGPLTVAGGVTGVSVSSRKRIFADFALAAASPPYPGDYFVRGVVTFTTGANAGLKSEVKDFDPATGTLVLWQEMIEDIAPGDAFTVTPGCNLSKAMCKDRWANYINFGGFPDVPGDDAASETPDAKY